MLGCVHRFVRISISSSQEDRARSSIGSELAWHASGPELDPHIRHILSWRFGHENISTAILPISLIQKEQLSVTGKECALSTGKLPSRLAQEQCG